jgi:XcyI restriction endonuclease
MKKKSAECLDVLSPDVQISFAKLLVDFRRLCLTEAIREAVRVVSLEDLDSQLREYAPPESLRRLASFGLRGELVFPTPLILVQSPGLLAYYRLLFGISQKEFYGKGRFGGFKRLEERGEAMAATLPKLPALCISLCQTAALLVEGLDELSASTIHDLQMLTLGSQLRGSRNTKIGDQASIEVLELIAEVVGPLIKKRTTRHFEFENAAGRRVLVEFASDPDVKVTEIHGTTTRLILSIEIKGGTDVSNIHNRLGEAEKSHLKAKAQGCSELWTIIRVDLPTEAARPRSPTTTRFFNLNQLLNRTSRQYTEFHDALAMHLGIRLK